MLGGKGGLLLLTHPFLLGGRSGICQHQASKSFQPLGGMERLALLTEREETEAERGDVLTQGCMAPDLGTSLAGLGFAIKPVPGVDTA